jgi:hypothetical protein
MNAFSQSLIKKMTTNARTLIEKIELNQGFAIDEGGKIKHEWLQVCDKVYFGTWFVDALKSGKIRAVVAKLDQQHSKKLRITCGMPAAGYDMAYIAVANSVAPPKYIVSEDIDFWEPSAKDGAEAKKQEIKTKRQGCVCKYLEGLGIIVGTIDQALAEL